MTFPVNSTDSYRRTEEVIREGERRDNETIERLKTESSQILDQRREELDGFAEESARKRERENLNAHSVQTQVTRGLRTQQGDFDHALAERTLILSAQHRFRQEELEAKQRAYEEEERRYKMELSSSSTYHLSGSDKTDEPPPWRPIYDLPPIPPLPLTMGTESRVGSSFSYDTPPYSSDLPGAGEYSGAAGSYCSLLPPVQPLPPPPPSYIPSQNREKCSIA